MRPDPGDPVEDVSRRLKAAGLIYGIVAEINAVDRADGTTFAEIIVRPGQRDDSEPRIREVLAGCDFEILDYDRRRGCVRYAPPPSGTNWWP